MIKQRAKAFRFSLWGCIIKIGGSQQYSLNKERLKQMSGLYLIRYFLKLDTHVLMRPIFLT